jgi:hypothetical protein
MQARFVFLLSATAFAGCVTACISDVEYLRAGDKGTNPGTGGSAGSGGSDGVGGNAVGGSNSAGNAGRGGGSSGSAGVGGNGGSGGSVINGCVLDSRVIERFDFAPPAPIVDSSQGGIKLAWSKGPYDSTDTRTGGIDTGSTSPQPPANPFNLANMSKLEADAALGNPAPAMRLKVPFATRPPQEEHVHILQIFANYQEPSAIVNLTNRTLKADVQLAVAPNPNCTIRINAWTTGTDAGAKTFAHIDGPSVTLTRGVWTPVEMNLNLSSPASSINQMGFAVHSKCTDVGGSGGQGGGGGGAGGDAGQGGDAGAQSAGQGGQGGSGGQAARPTSVILLDNITVNCQ